MAKSNQRIFGDFKGVTAMEHAEIHAVFTDVHSEQINLPAQINNLTTGGKIPLDDKSHNAVLFNPNPARLI